MSVCKECLFDKLWTDETTTCPKECEGCQIIDGEPSKFKPKPKTNADRIRSMTDEELAETLIRYNDLCDMFMADDGMKYYDFEAAKEAELEWLKQPAE